MKSYRLLIIACSLITGSCSKSHFLAENPSGQFTRPETVAHCMALLNNTFLMNITPALGEQSADDYYYHTDVFNALRPQNREIYTFQKVLTQEGAVVTDWDVAYQQLYVLNLVLQTLSGITPATDTAKGTWQHCKGYALFMRSLVLHNLAQVFAPVYDPPTAAVQTGVVLQLNNSWGARTTQSSLEDTYTRIVADLSAACQLVPENLSEHYRHLPARPAVYAMLARVYHSMSDYAKAGLYADSCLQLYNTLMDFNTLRYATGEKFMIPAVHAEALYSCWQQEGEVLKAGVLRDCMVDSVLYSLYESNDLRKKVFYALNAQGRPYYRNGYNGNIFLFSGLAVDEVLLIRAESRAMQADTATAMADVNRLLEKRYTTGSWHNRRIGDAAEVLAMVREERRKELVFRGLRWMDLRRYNREGAGITLRRVVNGQVYQLLPGSKNYVLPVPAKALNGTAIKQHERE